MLIGMSGVLGALISLPSAFTLLLCRQYLDYQLLRMGSRRYSFVRERVLRYLPVVVLSLSHMFVLILSLASAPQLTRGWLSEGNKLSEWLAGGHFVMTSLTRSAHAIEPRAPQLSDKKAEVASARLAKRRVHLVLIPADQMDSEEFKSELEKFKQFESVPFIIQRSSVNEQVESLMLRIPGETAELARKALSLPKSYNRVVSKKNSQTVVSMSPQIRFGKELAGYGTEYLTGFNDSIMHQETQRRLVLSQIQLFGLFRAFNGVPFLSSNLQWLNLIADDVARIRTVSKLVSTLDNNKESIIVIQLFGLEQAFSNVNPPFRPVGWQLSQSSYEKRIVNKKVTRELFQYLSDFSRDERSQWLILPYADDKRLNPKSVAVFSKSDPHFLTHMKNPLGSLYTNIDVARALTQESPTHVAKATEEADAQLNCVETELDLKNSDFSFQAIFNRERSLGQLLNYLPQMRDSDLSFLGRSGTSFVTRELGLGFICRNLAFGRPEQYLLKFRGTREQPTEKASNKRFYSALVERGDGRASEKTKVKSTEGLASTEMMSMSRVNINAGVLTEFSVSKLTAEQSGASGEEVVVWKLLDEKNADYFYQRFQGSVLEAIEASARARIR